MALAVTTYLTVTQKASVQFRGIVSLLKESDHYKPIEQTEGNPALTEEFGDVGVKGVLRKEAS